jgi:hypothetical protein
MLDELLRCDVLGGKEELQFLIFDALPLADRQKVSDLHEYCVSNRFSIGRYFDGSLTLLQCLGLVHIADGYVSTNAQLHGVVRDYNREAYFDEGVFVQELLLALKRNDSIPEFIVPDGVKRDPNSGGYYVRSGFIPIRFFGIRNLLISLGFFRPQSTLGGTHLLVGQPFERLFETLVLESLRPLVPLKKKGRSLADLKRRLESQELLGAEAEKFVVDFERARLRGHPNIQGVQRISEEEMDAGYDIESFNDQESVFLDRFIEVKSFAGEVLFYWSEHEIEVATEMGEKYYLYLVDRRLLAEPGYCPKILQNPYPIIFGSEFWEKEPNSWRIRARQTNG